MENTSLVVFCLQTTNAHLRSLINALIIIIHRSRQENFMSVKLYLFSYPSTESCVLGAQNDRLIETIFLVHTTYVLDEK